MRTLFIIPLVLMSLVLFPSWGADYKKGLAAYDRGDFETALREWTPLADQGHTEAQYNLGVMYDNGNGVTQDYKTAVKWYTLAAEQGDAKAQFNLGYMYLDGLGIKSDIKQALHWYLQAANQGYADAQYNVGKILIGDVSEITSKQIVDLEQVYDFAKGINWLIKGVELGHSESLNSLGFLILNDERWPNSQRDVEKACQFFSIATQTKPENIEAHNNLGACHSTFLPRKNVDEAIKHHKIAAEGGLVEAMSNLGGLLFTKGYKNNNIKDRVEGLMWLKISASHQNQGAIQNLELAKNYVNEFEQTMSSSLSKTCIEKDYSNCQWN